ncbi:hypothetical protein [Thermaurantiacus sp.]
MTPDCDWMVILTYTPRADSDARGYEEWLRQVDNVFFNGILSIAHYANWAVGRAIAGAPGFTHFDFMRFVSEADIDRAWSNADLLAFAAGWVARWGAEPAAPDPSANYHAHVARRRSGTPGDDAAPLFLALNPPAPAEGDELWEVIRPIVGVPPFRRFAIRRGAAPEPGYAPIVFEGRLIAAP